MTKQRAEEMECTLVRNLRFLANKTKTTGDVEKSVGVSPGYLSRIAHGKREISLRKAIMFADAVGIDLMEAMTVDVERQRKIEALERKLSDLRDDAKKIRRFEDETMAQGSDSGLTKEAASGAVARMLRNCPEYLCEG